MNHLDATSVADADLRDLEAAVRGVLERHWPIECRTGRGAQLHLETMARETFEHGWLEPIINLSLPVVVSILTEFGRANCGLPLVDALVAAQALSGTDVPKRIAAGEVTVVVGEGQPDGTVEFLEAAELATHVLALPSSGGEVQLYALEQGQLELTPSIAPQSWSRIRLSGPPELTQQIDAEPLRMTRRLLRFGLAVRALGAARRAHEYAVEHSKTRTQFQRPIGAFQAVSHRIASCEIDVASSAMLLNDAVSAPTRSEHDTALVVALANAFVIAAAPRIVLGALHTLGGMGFHEEHEAAWLFRRVQGDVARSAMFESATEDADSLLFDENRAQPEIDLGEKANAFRQEVSSFFAEHWSPDRELDEDAQFDPEVGRLLVERGWLGAGWPTEWGGQDRSPEELLALNEEVRYRGVPVRRLFTTVNIVGGAIIRHGTDEQKRQYLPRIRAGETLFALGYSEPEAGSDLASLRTSARETTGGWLVSGQKIFTTFGHRSDYHWLAVRTDPEAKPLHAGISVFIVPLDSPGITIQENHALNGETTTTTYYDDVFVPDEAVVGGVNGGWRVIGTALSVERIQMGGNVAELRAILDRILVAMHADPDRYAGARGSWQRHAVVEITARLHAVRLLVVSGLRAMAAGETARLPAAMAKVAGGEVAERLAEVGLQIFGPHAALTSSAPGTVADGAVERMLRLSPMYVIGGGTNDIQRNLIARELGLPR
jgi:alkylation response protein AidB-like acyl-CoA dehydrogenase